MPLISAKYLILLALALVSFYLCPKKGRWLILTFFGIAFYALSGHAALIYMLTVSLSSYIFALILQKCRKEGSGFALRTLGFISLAIIVVFWVLSRSSETRILGISFYSLRAMSYLIEVGRGRMSTERNFMKYLLFISFFSIALLGPVARYDEMSKSLFSGNGSTSESFLSGFIRLLWGVFKKCVIANMLSAPLGDIYGAPDRFSGAYVIFLLVFYSAEIYCDFSGGIDIAIGSACMFGIALPENFDRPFSSRSLGEFWKRWHITLGRFFESYVFYPISFSKPMQRLSRYCRRRLGDNIGKKLPVYIATMLTWLMTGLWHGARWNFIAWGIINGALVLLSGELSPHVMRFFAKHPRIKRDGAVMTLLGRVKVLLIIGAVRLLDVYKSLPLTLRMLSTVFFDLDSFKAFFGGGLLSLLSVPKLITLTASLSLVFFVSDRRVTSRDIAKRPIYASLCTCLLILMSLTFGTYGLGFASGDFIYSQY